MLSSSLRILEPQHRARAGEGATWSIPLIDERTHSRRRNAHKNVALPKLLMHFQSYKGLKLHKFSGGACLRTPLAYDCLQVGVQLYHPPPPPPPHTHTHTHTLQKVLRDPCNRKYSTEMMPYVTLFPSCFIASPAALKTYGRDNELRSY